MRTTPGWRATGPGTLRRTPLYRRDLRADDLAVRVDYCGLCHTDLHAVRGHSPDAPQPLVPGHEFTGVVTETGSGVTAFSVGDPVAVGNIVDSCGTCPMCEAGQENFCHSFPTLTYGGTDRRDGSTTLGGFSREYVVREAFAYALPRAWIPPRPPRCCARASPSGSPCGPWEWGRAAVSRWPDSAVLGTSRSSSRWRWARRRPSSAAPRPNGRMPSGSVRGS